MERFDAAAADGIEASVSLSIAAATEHAGNVDAAAVNGKHADAPAQQEEASPSSNNISGDVDVVAAGDIVEAPAPAVSAPEEGASHRIVTIGSVDDAAAVEAVLGYTFADKSLLEAALTHASFRGAGAGENYKRLKFLGDHAISAVVARHLYRAHPELRPDSLSRLRDLNVGTEKLARAAVAWGLHRFLRHEIEMPFFALRVSEFAAEAAAYPVHSNGQVNAPPKQLADLVESLMGAVFLDSGSDLERLWQTFQRLADPLIGPEMLPRFRQPGQELEELCRGMGLSAPKIQKDWARSHTVTVVVDGETVGSATYSKRQVVAQNRAIVAAVNTIKARNASSTEALLKGEGAAVAGSTSLLQEEEAIAGLQVPITLGKRHACCRDDVAASNKRFETSS